MRRRLVFEICFSFMLWFINLEVLRRFVDGKDCPCLFGRA